ncbi:MAG: acetylxylan esterase [Chloroflexota bacterium]
MPDRAIASFVDTTPRPSDFDQFWDHTQAELASIPADPRCEPEPLRSNEAVETHAVRFTSLGGARIFAWLCLPRGRSGCPGLVLPPGYSGAPGVPRAWAGLGYAALQVSPRGHHRSDGEVAPGFPGYMTAGIEDPLTYIYRGAYCDIWRAVDVLLDRPEVDRARIGVTGGSQGGALSVIAAAGRPEIQAVAADVPFLTGIRDSLRLGSSYPYAEITDYLRHRPESEAQVLNTLDYVDTLNFADRIQAPTLLSAGLSDDVCPPETAYALYNRLRCPRDIRSYPYTGHEGGGLSHMLVKQAWLAAKLVPEQGSDEHPR